MKAFGNVPERITNQIEVVEIYKCFRDSEYAEVEKRAQRLGIYDGDR